MKILVPNSTWALCLSLTMLKWVGFWLPRNLTERRRILANVYTGFSLMYMVGFYISVQAAELLYVWGDISPMTSAAFMLFTNVALCLKMINVISRREQIQALVDEADEELRAENRVMGKALLRSADRETSFLLYFFIFLSMATVFGLEASVEKRTLPLQARYPYDTNKSPAFELTYFHQSTALCLAALVNISLDTLATSLIAQSCCRLNLLALSLKNLCVDLGIPEQNALSMKEEKIALDRLRICIAKHQAILSTVTRIQNNFSEPIFAQFTVSIFIICVTAYQLAFEIRNLVRLLSMLMYLGAMMLQVFLYCHQGNELSVKSVEIAAAAYECPWHTCSARFRRQLLMIMTRSVQASRITAGGITTLTLNAFTSIIKASYTFFTVLQSVQDRN